MSDELYEVIFFHYILSKDNKVLSVLTSDIYEAKRVLFSFGTCHILNCSYMDMDLNRSKIEKFLDFEVKLIKLNMFDMTYEGGEGQNLPNSPHLS